MACEPSRGIGSIEGRPMTDQIEVREVLSSVDGESSKEGEATYSGKVEMSLFTPSEIEQTA